ncbi:N-methyl-L-tryptophan oxidase [Salinithrix halophila]|uniref:N-methyl-L-tryptophan oxidase n=1 Tax=Salinithrix halophila TaxID=1485204 RepID=A0ABV8JIF8_9BACL
MSAKNYDVIIIGAGSMGMSAGYFMAKNGRKTLLLDSLNPPHNKGSHHGDTRIIRHAYGEGKNYVPLALRAQALWLDLEEQVGKKLFYNTGVLNVGDSKSAFIHEVISSAKEFLLPLEIMDSQQIMDRWPGITLPGSTIGCLESASGVLKSEECIRAYRQQALAYGATILTQHPVKNLSVLKQGVRVETDEGTFLGDALILCGGAWSPKLFSQVNIQVPLHPIRTAFAWFDAAKELYEAKRFPAFNFHVEGGQFYGFPSFHGSGIKVGFHNDGKAIDPDQRIRKFEGADEEPLRGFLDTYMPHIKRLKQGQVCIYTMTLDENFIIDLHPEYPHVAVAAGFSGHGFKFSSVVGEILSELIVSGQSTYDLSPFSIKRFDHRYSIKR